MPSSEERVTVEMPSSSSEKRVAAEDENQQKLIGSRKKLRTNLINIGVLLLIVIVSLLCSFLIPGLPQYHKVNLWQFAAELFILTAVFIGYELFCPETIEEPKPLTGVELC